MLTNNPHLLPYPLQYLQGPGQLILRMRSAHDGPQARFSFSNRGISNPRSEHAFIEQLTAEVHGEAAFANNDRRDRRLAGGRIDAADVEAQQSQLFLKE